MITFTIEAEPELAYRIYDEFEDQNITHLENGQFLICGEFPKNDWVYGYLLSFGEKIKIIEPESLKEEIRQKLEKMLEQTR